MSGKALVIAAHGSRASPSASQQVRGIVRQVANSGLFDEVTPAFHLGEPSFASVLDTLWARDITVVPLMTSEGHFSQSVLPREFARNKRFEGLVLHQTSPVGTHPHVAGMVERRLTDLGRLFEIEAKTATVAIVGHGTQRHPHSRDATENLAHRLRRRGLGAEVLTGFLDDNPSVESILNRMTGTVLIAFPFLIGGGLHAVQDLPGRLGLERVLDRVGPFSGWVRDRFVVCDRAIGEDPKIADIVLDLATGG